MPLLVPHLGKEGEGRFSELLKCKFYYETFKGYISKCLILTPSARCLLSWMNEN